MQNPPLVLIADDEPEVLSLYASKLESVGLAVLTAKDGAEAVTLCKSHLPDLILLDIKMPNMDGATALQTIKSDAATKDLKVVFVTAFSDPKVPDMDEEFSIKMGALGYIKKGIKLQEFADEVLGYLQFTPTQAP